MRQPSLLLLQQAEQPCCCFVFLSKAVFEKPPGPFVWLLGMWHLLWAALVILRLICPLVFPFVLANSPGPRWPLNRKLGQNPTGGRVCDRIGEDLIQLSTPGIVSGEKSKGGLGHSAFLGVRSCFFRTGLCAGPVSFCWRASCCKLGRCVGYVCTVQRGRGAAAHQSEPNSTHIGRGDRGRVSCAL
jgi:hypothetical protein